MSDDPKSVMAQLDAQIVRVRAAGLTPVSVVLSYEDLWRFSYHDLGGPGVGYPRAHPYYSFVPRYRGLEVICPGLAYDGPPTIGVRAASGSGGLACGACDSAIIEDYAETLLDGATGNYHLGCLPAEMPYRIGLYGDGSGE